MSSSLFCSVMSIGYSEGRIEKISEGSGMHQMIRVSLNLSLPIESEVIDLFYLFQLPNGLYFDDYELEVSGYPSSSSLPILSYLNMIVSI